MQKVADYSLSSESVFSLLPARLMDEQGPVVFYSGVALMPRS